MRLWEITTEFVGFYSPEPRVEVSFFRLNFNISKLVYHFFLLGRHCPARGPGNPSERFARSSESQQVHVSLDNMVNHTNY